MGAGAAALVRAAGGRASRAWLLAGLLAGVFSVHLVAGYLANLVLAACFLAAAACLAGDRRAWWAAALLLAGGGLAHPPFLVHAIVVLLGAAVLAWRAGARDEARDIALAVTAGGLVAGAGVLATIAGPGPIHAETSKDGYLRRAGLDRELVDAYRERFRLRAARYVQWISVPLAVAGTTAAGRLPPAVPHLVARGDRDRRPDRLRDGMATPRPIGHVRVRGADRCGARSRVAASPA